MQRIFVAVAALAALLALVSLLVGLFRTSWGRDKEAGLIRRMWTETLRRFYFQFLLRHLHLAVDVMARRKPVLERHAAQARDLSKLRHEEM